MYAYRINPHRELIREGLRQPFRGRLVWPIIGLVV